VRADETWSPAARLKRNYEKSASCIHLDALTGTVRGEQLLRRWKKSKRATILFCDRAAAAKKPAAILSSQQQPNSGEPHRNETVTIIL
jgi:hypothetical protein